MRGSLLISLLFLLSPSAVAQHGVKNGQWSHFGGDPGNTKYSSLDQINADNFHKLEQVWTWESVSKRVTESNRRVRAGQFKPIPLVIGGRMFVATEVSQVAAIDTDTGETVWVYDPKSYEAGRPANVGWQHRGVAYWNDGADHRIFIATHDRKLIAINADNGKPVSSFGDNGVVDLETSLGRTFNPRHITHTSPPAVCRDSVIVGSIVHDGPVTKEAPPGHVRGFDARTGEMKWRFHTIPQEGEFGNETWENGSWKYTGAANVWSMMAVDEELGYVYLPTSTPTNDMYGGHRLGDNLFAESIVCLDADTGERVWHFQAVHHGLWDYDLPTAPNLVDVTVDGREVKLLAQVSKQAFTYVFDRVTGEPIWPIEERPVPQTAVPGERTSPTQPFPTKPKPFDRQGISKDDLVDFTPELRAKALDIVEDYTLGPLYTPPVTAEESQGTIMVPSTGGGANWPGAAVDPETGILYVPSATSYAVYPLIKPDPTRSNLRYVLRSWLEGAPRIQGLPILKPPYARVTAIDLKTGEHLWMTPNGSGPRQHPLLKNLELPPLGTSSGAPLLTKTLLFVTQGQGFGTDETPRINVFEKTSGELLGHIPLPDVPHANPITYMSGGKQHIAVGVGGGPFFSGVNADSAEGFDPGGQHQAAIEALSKMRGTKPMLVAFALP